MLPWLLGFIASLENSVSPLAEIISLLKIVIFDPPKQANTGFAAIFYQAIENNYPSKYNSYID